MIVKGRYLYLRYHWKIIIIKNNYKTNKFFLVVESLTEHDDDILYLFLLLLSIDYNYKIAKASI